MSDKHLLTEKEINAIRKEIFKYNSKVVIPRGVMTYLMEKDLNVSTKGKILYSYIGIILCYNNAYYTYRKHHMNLNNILDVMNIGWSKIIRKEFTKNGYFEKEGYITHQNYFPVHFEISTTTTTTGRTVKFPKFINSKELSKEELTERGVNWENRYMNCIEPTLHVVGKRKKKGRGYQYIQKPLNIEPSNYITISLETISKVLEGELSEGTLFYLCYLKHISGNKNIVESNKFQTSIKSISTGLNTTDLTTRKYHKELKQVVGEINYGLIQRVRNVEGILSSKVYLKLNNNL